MIEAELWSQGVHILDLNHVAIKKCRKYLTWGENEHILDIGGAEGHTTCTTIKPIIPNFQQFTIVAINSDMIELLKKKINDPRINAEVGDVLSTKLASTYSQTFRHAFCMLILHWLQDKQRLCLENIFKMLKPGGELIVTSLVTTGFYDSFLMMVKEPKWSQYPQKVPEYISTYKTCENPLEKFQSTLTEVGFEVVFIEGPPPSSCRFPDLETLNNFAVGVYPDIALVPDHLRAEFTNCYLEKFRKTDTIEFFSHRDGNVTGVELRDQQMYAVVKKPL